MNARIICVASAKGGSGKTSLTATLGTFLSNLGKRVLLVDADYATNGLTLFYVKDIRVEAELLRSKSKSPRGLFEGLSNRQFCDITPLGEKLSIIPATYNLQLPESIDARSAPNYFTILFKELRDAYDYIFIDAQAGLDEMAQIAMSRQVSDEVVIVSEFDPMSAAGVERMKAMLRDDLTYERTWVLLNKILPEFATTFSDFLEVAKYLNPIPWDAEVVRAYARRRLAINTETGNEYTISAMQTLKGLCGDEIHEALAEWVQSRAAVIRQPLDQQYSDAEKELKTLLYQRAMALRRKSKFQLSFIAASAFFAIGASYFVYRSSFFSELFSILNINSSLWAFSLIPVSFVWAFYIIARLLFQSPLFERPDVDRQIEDERLDRQSEVLKEKLKKLEVLKSLDAESLLVQRISKTQN
ncbi:ParA family protein [Burkholderia gladioli]|uniref:ParA family protein n=1 Tax=Burkholderia gladioli TaxID=28095 RepID=UPI001C23CBD9|nr:ParA family protein [Burkholderia gladioli]MBU9643616.1 ParA family protein [Burkholderia gladioli]